MKKNEVLVRSVLAVDLITAAYFIVYSCNIAGCDRKGNLIPRDEFHEILGGGNHES